MSASTWTRPTSVRLDFARLATLANSALPPFPPPPPALPSSDSLILQITADSNKIVYVESQNTELSVFRTENQLFVSMPPSSVTFFSDPHPPCGWEYSTARIETLIKIVKEKRARMTSLVRSSEHAYSQGFVDCGMDLQDWQSLGFTPPTRTRPALDRHGREKGLMNKSVCVTYQHLDLVEESCSGGFWENYLDSCQDGVFFSRLVVSTPAWSGLTAGMSPGSEIVPSEDFESDLPYRPAWTDFRANSGPLPPQRRYGVVFFRSGQYVGFDPSISPVSEEVNIRWKSLPSWQHGIFSPRGRYLPASQVRSTYYVSPRNKTKMVWEQGARSPIPSACLLSPSSGGQYTPRPSKKEYRYLVEKYGRAAVPRNFNKYKEDQIKKRSRLMSYVADGEWVFVPDGASPDSVIGRAFALHGSKPVPWRVLRNAHLPGEVERDPCGKGLYAKLVSREEIFTTPERMKKMAKMMKSEGWDFVLEEIALGSPALRRGVFSMITG